MRLLGVASVVLALIAGSACENCSCGSTKAPLQVLLTDADANAVISVSGVHEFGVELGGSGRRIAVSDPARLEVLGTPPQPDGKTLTLFRPISHISEASKLPTFGGAEVLSASRQGSHPAWQATVIADTGFLNFQVTNVVTVGLSWLFEWPVGGEPPLSSDIDIVTPFGDPAPVTSAVVDLTMNAVTIESPHLEQMFTAVAPGTAVVTPPLPPPIPTNLSRGGGYGVIAKFNPDWVLPRVGVLADIGGRASGATVRTRCNATTLT